MKVYKDTKMCEKCKAEFFSKPYDHRDATPGQLGYCIHCDNCLIKEKKMEFDKSRVFTSLNADELKQGDKVIVADQLAVLKQRVQEGKKESAVVLQKINGEDWGRRFGFKMSDFALAYLVERAENCTNCKYSNPHKNLLYCEDDNIPIYVGGEKLSVCDKYEPKTEPKAENCTNCGTICSVPKTDKTARCWAYKPEPKAEQFGKTEQLNCRPFRDTDELVKVWCDKGGKWQKRELTMPHIWVREKGCDKSADLITCYGSKGITVRGKGMYFDTLFTMFEFLDGSPCGVEE